MLFTKILRSVDTAVLESIRDMEPPKHEFCFPPFFPQNFLSWAIEKETELFISSKLRKKKICFGPTKSLLSFSTAQTEKNLWKKLGEKIGCLVDWCQEQDINSTYKKPSLSIPSINFLTVSHQIIGQLICLWVSRCFFKQSPILAFFIMFWF